MKTEHMAKIQSALCMVFNILLKISLLVITNYWPLK